MKVYGSDAWSISEGCDDGWTMCDNDNVVKIQMSCLDINFSPTTFDSL
jgi:hypothetical protein